MAQFYIHRSNQVERLVAELAEQLHSPLGGPLQPERVVVQGRGMGVWLSHELATSLGVWAGQMLYPRHFIEDVARVVLSPEACPTPALSQDVLEWAVHAVVNELSSGSPATNPLFAPVLNYISNDTAGLLKAQLSARIAQTFDQYLVYRPELLRAWETAPDDNRNSAASWQSILWQRVVQRLGGRHIARVEQRLLDRLRSTESIVGLPPRISLFGISTLPPLYVRAFAAVSRHIDVHLFLFSPSPERGGATYDSKGGARRVDVANPLLASLGFLGADFDQVLRAVLTEQGIEPVEDPLYEPPDRATLLSSLQADIYDLRSEPSVAEKANRNIAVHSCHGPTREVEILRDQILALTSRKEDPVKPEEIVVLCPDIESYAPLIDAVFARPVWQKDHLPFHISDRSTRRESPVMEAIFRILSMVRGRVTATEVADLLKVEPIQLRFDLDSADVEQIERWLVDSGLHWGMDAAHRGSRGLPATEDFTWSFGLKRLLLGYAMSEGEEAHILGGVLPYAQIEGQDAQLLGKFAHFSRSLFRWLRDFEVPRSIQLWNASVTELANELFAQDATTARQVVQIRQALGTACAAAEQAQFVATLDVAVIRDLLDHSVDVLRPERGFLSGGIMFCALLPMRSIPYRVVCLLGMNDGTFPRSPRPLEFDLIAMGSRRAGDRSPREDDRYLFLETLCAAREQVIITYTGRALKDNKPLPPSVCINELLDRVGESVRVHHRLQGFNPQYFQGGDSDLFSYSADYAKAAATLYKARVDRPALADSVLKPSELVDVRLDELIRFYRSPQAYFLNRRLGVDLNEYEVDLSDREPLDMGGLDSWEVGDELLNGFLAGRSADQTEALLRAAGKLPWGHKGHLLVQERAKVARNLAERTLALRGGSALAPCRVNIPLSSGRKLSGSIDNLWPGGFVEHTYSELAVKRLIASWLRHLAACANGAQFSSTLIGRDGDEPSEYRWRPLDPAGATILLSRLVEFYDIGLTCALPFLPATSKKYVAALTTKKSPKEPAQALLSAINFYSENVCDDTRYDPHPRRAFGDALPPFEPCDPDDSAAVTGTLFHRAAIAVYQPLLEAIEE